MPQKAKARTGTALPDLAEPDDESGQPTPISDAQASDLKPSGPLGGFNASPNRPTGPSYPSMGGSATQPSDFAQQVNAATAVPSKGGPPVEDLYASSGKGPVGRLRSPQQSDATSEAPTAIKMPEFKPPPPREATVVGGPAAESTPAQGQAAAPQVLPGFANPDRVALIQKAFQRNQIPYDPNADYSHVDPYIAQDPDFAGLDPRGDPVFMGPDGKPYYRDETGVGKEIRHFFEEPPGTEAAKNGRPYENQDKIAAAEEARNQLGAMMDTQKAIQHWKDLQAAFLKAHPDGENILQRMALEARMSGDQGWQATIAKAAAGLVPGVTPDMEELAASLNNMVLPYKASFAKGKESLRIPGSEIGGTPTVNDDFSTQMIKVRAMEDRLRDQAQTLRSKFPYASQQVDKLLQNFITASGGSAQQGAQQNAPTGTTARPAITPGGTSRQPSQAEANAAPHLSTQEGLAKLKSGDLFYDDLDGGKLKRKH